MSKAVILFVIFFFTAQWGWGQDIKCQNYQANILRKINSRYDSLVGASAGNPGCDVELVANEVQTIMVERCVKPTIDAEEVCNEVHRPDPGRNSGGGAGGTQGQGMTAVSDSATLTRRQGHRCGRRLEPIPRSCKAAGQDSGFQILSHGCSPDQINQLRSYALDRAAKNTMRFCQAVEKHWNQSQENIRLEAVARKTLKKGVSQTHRGAEGK